jgi:hypothetical protein
LKTFAEKAIQFYSDLELRERLPEGVKVMNPYRKTGVMDVVSAFFRKYYGDNRERLILLGINPGRFGAGVTGVTFTDPIRLETDCGIPNSFEKRAELSSRFIYEVIQESGGPEAFFSRYYLSAVSPLGFTRSGKNMNYYDERSLEKALEAFISSTLEKQAGLGIRRDSVVCLGEGQNFRYLRKLNEKLRLFGKIYSLPHPRWVMQYRFRKKGDFIRDYRALLGSL